MDTEGEEGVSETLLLHGDCIETMRGFDAGSVDAVVCDPPYDLSDGISGKGFMGKAWDGTGIAFRPETWREVLRVLKPGGYLLAFGGTRTYHRMAVAIEDAGFQIRDCIGWHYGSGFPKSLAVDAAIDKAMGAEREVVGVHPLPGYAKANVLHGTQQRHTTEFARRSDVPATDAAAAWRGWGTALKPAWEPVVVARKPLEGTVAGNVLQYGTGAMNIDGCRVRLAEGETVTAGLSDPANRAGVVGRDLGFTGNDTETFQQAQRESIERTNTLGRWPANVILSHAPDCGEECVPGCPCAAMDAQSGVRKSGRLVLEPGKGVGAASENVYQGGWGDTRREDRPASEGGASRFFNQLPIEADDLVPFFYAAKASRSEREEGCDTLEAKPPPAVETKVSLKSPRAGAGRLRETVLNNHPTVKPVSVMAWCLRLVVPPGGLVLDPFMGSGTTGVAAVREGFDFVGIEREEEYLKIAEARVEHARKKREG